MNLKPLWGMVVDLKAIIALCLIVCSLIGGARAEAVEPKIATGRDFTAYLAPDGTVWTWGYNIVGQLGLGDQTDRLTPTQIPTLSNVVSIAAGEYHMLALKADGTVWAWGYNDYGQAGQGSTSFAQTTPIQVPIPGGAQIGAIACGGYHCLALGSPSGAVYSWGLNNEGQLGKGDTSVQYSPLSIGWNFRSISGGGFHTLAIDHSGRPYAWGDDSNGQLGDDAALLDKPSPTQVSGAFTDVVSVSAGGYHSLMVGSTGLAYTWGDDSSGQLGNGSSITADQATPYYLGYNVWKVMAGATHSLIFYPGGYVWAFGDNSEGQCQQNPTTTKYESPLGLGWLYPRPNELVGGCASRFVMMTQSNGALMGWGDNSFGQLGLGSTSNYQFSTVYPAALWSLDVFISVSAGNAHTLALKADGTVWAWGSDGNGQLGDDATLANKTSPVQVTGVSNVMEVCAGGYHSLALTTSGSVYAWGWDYYGQLGNDASLTDSPIPVVSSISGVKSLGAGAYHSLAVYAFGNTVRAWGANGSGQLGDATNTQQPTPVAVSGASSVMKVEGGYQHSLALTAGGAVLSWGADWNGQLGNDAAFTSSNIPVTVSVGSLIDIAAGQGHSTAPRTTGVTRAWGGDYSGQLGNGATAGNQALPTATTSPFIIKKAAAGADFADFSIYLANNGAVYSCGSDVYGQLGDDLANTDQPGLVQVSGLSQICAITAGDFHAHALGADGTLYSWGYNALGQLGNDSLGTNSSTPVVVTTNTWTPTISLTIPDSSASEAGETTGTIRFTRSFTNYGVVTVNYSLAGVAVNGSDYNTLTGVATIPAGASFVDVLLTPEDDSIDEDNESVDVTLISGSQYRIGSPSNGSLVISDNDTSGFVISAISSNTLEADQAGGVARTFTVRLATEPSNTVVLNFSTTNSAEGLVDTNDAAGNQSATTLSFTAADWNTSKTVQVFGRDDNFDDGNIGYFIAISVNQASTLDPRYDPLDPPDVSVTNVDNDTAGVVISAALGAVTEAGGTTTFTITLASQPYNPVNFTLSSSDTTEGVLQAGSSSVTINPANWNTGATITVQGVNDDVDDGNQSFKIDIAKSTSSDPAYNNLGGWDVPVTCNDDDTKGVTIDTDLVTAGVQATPVAVTEGGATGSFTVRLNSQPTAQVTLTINTPASTQVTVDTDAGTVGNQSTLVFTTANWSTAQTVRVTAVDDATIETSPHNGTILSVVNGGSGDYSSAPAVTVANVTCNITDNDAPGFTVLPITATNNRQVTTESGGTASFTVRLNTQPTGAQTVSLRLNTTDLGEGRISGQPIVLASTTTAGTGEQINFDDAVNLAALGLAINQNVTILGSTNNGGIQTTITAIQTTSPKYVQVAANLTDSGPEVIAFLPTPSSFPFVMATTSSVVSPTNRFNVSDAVDLSQVPVGSTVLVTSSTANVGVRGIISSRSNTAGSKHLIINPTGSDTVATTGAETLLLGPPATLVFSSGNWNVDQTITVTGQDDLTTDPTAPQNLSNYSIDFAIDTGGTTDPNYTVATTPANQFMRNQDDDQAGVRIVQDGGATAVDESNTGATDTYRVRLNTAPDAGKVVVIQINPDSQLSTNKSLLVFTSGNYSTEQVVTVSAVNDNIDENPAHFGAITHAVDTALTDDPTYDLVTGLDPVNVSILDNDNAGITVSPTVLVTTEAGFASNFTVALSSEPTANVSIGIVSGNPAEGTVSAASLVFTPANWYIGQSITVTGVDEAVDDGDVAYLVATAAATSADGNYNLFNAADVLVINVDDDVAGVTAAHNDGSTTVTEGGTTDTISVVLATEPAAGTVVVTLSPGSQVTLSSTTLTFTDSGGATPWNVPQAVTVTAVNDAVAEGSHSTTIGFSASGLAYTGVSIAPLTVSITDNDTAGTTVSAAAVTTSESGNSGTFTFNLNTQPTANVTVVLTSSDASEGTVSPSSLTFTPGNFSTTQTVTLTGADDDVADGPIGYDVDFTLVSADPAYNNLAVASKAATNNDDDSAGFIITAISNALREDGTSGRFTVRLTSEPVDDVTIGVAVGDATEASVSLASLSFDANNWNQPQEVTVSGVDDALNDGDIASFVVLSADTTTSDPDYLNNNPTDVAISTQDDDQAGVSVSTPAISTSENGLAMAFSVQLLSEPNADVTIPLVSGDTTEGTVSPASLLFTAANWNIPQTVTVTPVDDFAVDGSVIYTLALNTVTTTDTTGYSGLNPNDVTITNADDDAAGFPLSATIAATAESGTSVGIQIQLTSQPASDVVLTVSGLDATEGSLSAPSLTFTSGNWNNAQTLTITGVNDAYDDDDQIYVLTLTPSGDSTYAALTTQTITVTNADDDAAGVIITQSGGTTVVNETGTTDTYTVQLASRPLTTATVTVTPDSQVRVNGVSTPVVLTFDPALFSGEPTAWNTVRTITVSAVVDTFDEANPHAANITHTVANYVDQASAAVTASPVAVTVNDNDPPQTTVTSLTLGRGSSDTITSAMISATDDDTAAVSLVFTVILAPGQGELWLDYGAMGQDQLINGDTFTQAAITANRLTYRNSGTPNVSDGFAFRVSDAVGNQGDLTIFNIAITGYIPPIITLNGSYSPTYTENDLPVAVDNAPSVTDPDSVTYDLLTISLSGAGVSNDDELFFASGGTITASSGTILYSGTPIGTYVGGTGTTALEVTFNSGAAGDAQLTDLFISLRYRNTSEDPVAGTRTVSIVLLDDTTTANVAVTKDIAVLAINDPPVVANATVITPKNVAIDSTLTVFDVDHNDVGEFLTITVTDAPTRGTVSGAIDQNSSTFIDVTSSRIFTYTPSNGEEGIDTFTIEVTDPDGAVSTATITVLIIGGAAARPWIVSDAPVEAELGTPLNPNPLNYDIVVDFSELPTPPTQASEVTFTLVGNLPAGVTFGGFTAVGTNASLNLQIGSTATGVIEAGIVVTETASDTSGYQPITIVIVPLGTLGN
jgi:alpha-tubulin suppressor-like RCC1 family protein